MYKITGTNITRLSDNALIPPNPANRDYAQYLVWVAAGNTPEPADVPTVIVPQSVTRRQGRLALLEVDKLDQVEAFIDAIVDPIERRAAQIEYEADTWDRGNPRLQSLWTGMGGTEAELDALFVSASKR